MNSKTTRGRGRPPKDRTAMLEPITIRFPPAMMAEIDTIIAERLDAPEKGAIIRELIAEALVARKRKRAAA